MRIERENLNTRVYSVLKEMILNARFEPGARINVEQLAREMGVSRTPVWEAIRRLEHEGLVTNLPNRGVFMSQLDPQQARDLYAVREVLEGMAGRLAANHVADATIKKMEKSLSKQESVVERADVVAYSRLDFEFHALIYEASGNAYLREQLETLKAKMRPLGIHFENHLSVFLADHERILEALRARDPARAEVAMKQHNQSVLKILEETVVAGELFTAV